MKPNREQICSQQQHCLSCPLSVSRTSKDCRELTLQEIERIIQEVKKNENTKVYGTFR